MINGNLNRPDNQNDIYIQAVSQTNAIENQTKIIKFQTVIFSVILLIIAFVLISLSIKFSAVLKDADAAIVEITSLTEELNTILEETKLTELLNNANELIDEGGSGLKTALDGISDSLEKIESIDIDALNTAIRDLQKIVSPLSKLFAK